MSEDMNENNPENKSFVKRVLRPRNIIIAAAVLICGRYALMPLIESRHSEVYSAKYTLDEKKKNFCYGAIEAQENVFFNSAARDVYKFFKDGLTPNDLISGKVITTNFTDNNSLSDANVSFKAFAKPIEGFEHLVKGGRCYFVTAYAVYHDAEKSEYGLFGNAPYLPGHAIHSVGTLPLIICDVPANGRDQARRLLIPVFNEFFGFPSRGSASAINSHEPTDARDFWTTEKYKAIFGELYSRYPIKTEEEFVKLYTKHMHFQKKQIAFLRRADLKTAEQAVFSSLPAGQAQHVEREYNFFNAASPVLLECLSTTNQEDILKESRYNKGVYTVEQLMGGPSMQINFTPLSRSGDMKRIVDAFVKKAGGGREGAVFGVVVSPRYDSQNGGRYGNNGHAYYIMGDVNGQRVIFSFDPATKKIGSTRLDTQEKIAKDLELALSTNRSWFNFTPMNFSEKKAAFENSLR